MGFMRRPGVEKQFLWAYSQMAFTLVELLVVVAIIGALASLLLPALSRAKAAAQSAKCKNNLRQIDIGLNIYTADDRAYPIISSALFVVLPPKSDNGDTSGANINPVLFCPTGRLRNPQVYIYNWFPGWFSFASSPVSPVLLGGIPSSQGGTFGGLIPTPEAAVRVPSDMIAFTDGAYYSTFDPMRTANLKVWDDYPWTGLEDIYPHPKGVNQLQCDGHVAFVKKSEIALRSDRIRGRWFIDNLPHRDLVP
jgi:prepilin-type N-terminal cleavage/methylation domain-containing protein/prepilin-type processing-associated H-X9-DG protein